MKNGICPKCASTEIYHRAGSKFAHEMIELEGGLITKGASPDKYLCGQCGYLEYYLPLEEHIQVVRSNWDRVSTP